MHILNVGYSSTNYYVLADRQPRLLVDVGFAGTLAKLQHELKRVDVRLTDIPYLLATHFHPDHAGLALDLQKLGIKLVVLDVQVAALESARADAATAKHFVGYDAKTAVTVPVAESRSFLARIGIPGEIIHTAGHSDDSVSLVLDGGVVFTGDLTLPMMAGDAARETVLASWAAIRAAGGVMCHPGHGPVWRLGNGGGVLRNEY